jgi:hypothetical protein
MRRREAEWIAVGVVAFVVLGIVAAILGGCAGAPNAAQSSQVQVQPASDLSGTLKDIHAEMVTLRQQNQQLTETVNSMVQETGNLRAKVEEVRGDLNQVTQSFRAGPGTAEGRTGQPDRGRADTADRVQPGCATAAAGAVVGKGAGDHPGDRGAARGPDRNGKDGISWRVKLMWYCICLAVGFIGGVVTALLVAANNRQKADQVIDRAANVEQAVKDAATK